MSRQDANAAFALTSFLYGGNAAYIEDLYARYETDPEVGRRRMAGLLPEPERRPRATSAKCARPVLAAAGLAAAGAQRTDRGARRRLGRGRARRSATRSRPRRRRRASSCPAADVQRATRDSIRALMLIRAYRARGHFHANLDPLGLEPPQERGGAAIRAPTASPRPISTARFSSTRCSGSNSARCARSSPFCDAPIARRSASSSCISPTPRRRAGFRSASRARTRRSPSPARASARSSTSWSKPKASRNSAT